MQGISAIVEDLMFSRLQDLSIPWRTAGPAGPMGRSIVYVLYLLAYRMLTSTEHQDGHEKYF